MFLPKNFSLFNNLPKFTIFSLYTIIYDAVTSILQQAIIDLKCRQNLEVRYPNIVLSVIISSKFKYSSLFFSHLSYPLYFLSLYLEIAVGSSKNREQQQYTTTVLPHHKKFLYCDIW